MISVGLLLVGTAGLIVGALSNWTLGLGVIWFGASFVVLMAVAQSFRRDLSRRFPDE